MVSPITQSIALDLGTTSIKAGLVDDHCQLSFIDSLPASAIKLIDCH
jgi:sugar (pentulose or hexulose) kinase